MEKVLVLLVEGDGENVSNSESARDGESVHIVGRGKWVKF